MNKKEFARLRLQIDELDKQLVYLLNRRAEVVVELGRLKKQHGLKLYDPTREKEIFVRLTGLNPGPLSPDALVRLYERIIDESRRVERMQAYDDPEGS